MLPTSPYGSLPDALAQRIDSALDRVRALLNGREPDRQLLIEVRDLLIDAVRTRDGFTLHNFPLDPRTRDAVYLLSEDPDQRLALYLGMRDAALATPVHNHTTWACIVGVQGCEQNRFFERGAGGLRETGSAEVVHGSGVAMMHDDLHSIATDSGVLNMQLHLYGRSFEEQAGRVMVDAATGAERTFSGHPEVQIPHGRITAAMLRRMIDDGRELAVLDLRSAVEHCEIGHPLVASSLPLDRLADELIRRVPSRAARIVLLDDDPERASQAMEVLARAGYSRPFCLAGGVKAWKDAGYALFDGMNVPGKAFGEHLETAGHIPMITAATLAAWRSSGKPFVLVDCRTEAEHRRMTIPGSINLPGPESLSRIHALAPNREQPIVVHCAGRTRGLVATQTLIDAGCPNPVMALENGLIGWLLAGQALEMAGGRPVPEAGATLPGPDPQVPQIDAATLGDWVGDPTRTTYVFDVRSPQEFAAGHFPGAQLASGGELVQQIDSWVPVRHARVVLVGDDARARAVAALLSRMDWCEPALLVGSFDAVSGAEPERPAIPRGWRPPFDEYEQDPVRMRGYIQWELSLLSKLADDGSLVFR
ncbi:MAG: hypothetical protein EBT33_19485 [Betaproteobacteria bacterium]|nr:hypothetical protein [Betaproteobacteria bacterium]